MLINLVRAGNEPAQHLFAFSRVHSPSQKLKSLCENKKKRESVWRKALAACFHKTGCLNTIHGQMLKLSAECRSEGASLHHAAFHTCTEEFQFTGKALYDSAQPFCWAEIKHNTKKINK